MFRAKFYCMEVKFYTGNVRVKFHVWSQEAGFPQVAHIDRHLINSQTLRLRDSFSQDGFKKLTKEKAEDIAFAALLDKKDNGSNQGNNGRLPESKHCGQCRKTKTAI